MSPRPRSEAAGDPAVRVSGHGGALALRCRCGAVQGEARPDRTYARISCYCRDCQAYARWLGTPGLLDAHGGSDIIAMAPSGLRFTDGTGQIACATLSGRVYRWYAACCRTPLGNTARDPRVHYVGLCTASLPDPSAVDAAVGPAGRCVVHAASATAPVRATPLAFAWSGLRIATGVFAARLRGQRQSPFFDAATARPLREPERIATGA